MMWRVVLIMLVAGLDSARASATPLPRLPELTPAAPPAAASNLWFDVGEEISYHIYWGVINVGHSRVTSDWVTYEDGRTLLRIKFESRSNKYLAALYPVEDMQMTLIDPEAFLPVVSVKQSRQGHRYYDEITYFDHAAGEARWRSFNKDREKTTEIASDTRDLISLMYFIRNMEYRVGSEMTMQVYTDEKVYDLFLKVPRKEIVQLNKYGRVASLLFDPEAAFDGLFVRKGKVYIWVSDDARRLCTKITAKVPVASVRIELQEVRGPGADFWVGKRPSTPAMRVR